jgi:hypothetical protein
VPAILISGKVDFRAKNITRSKKDHFIFVNSRGYTSYHFLKHIITEQKNTGTKNCENFREM